jgi:6-pyruvoyltetrahydropterin/6-carboxytetrahydropterin synthase
MKYISTKTYGHERGLSCCFRQWRATSHCNQLHGYALSVRLTFGADELDDRNWVVDFGGLRRVKDWLDYMFDHTLVVAADDPFINSLKSLGGIGGVADVRVVDNVGCEAFAELIANYVSDWIVASLGYEDRVHLLEVEVREHDGNSAIYKPA